jgi:glycosyltransferase involved in cell wall biosynthesis
MACSVLILEPYCTGSHAAWAEGYAAHSRHRVQLLTLPGRFWKWRMHGAAVTLARRLLASDLHPDVILASDMLDVAAFTALARRQCAGVPLAVYFHENQLAYPAQPVDPTWSSSRQRRARARDLHYPFTNYTSALAADRVLWNSAFNRDSFLDALPRFLKQFPDHRNLGTVTAIREKSLVLPLGLPLSRLDSFRQAGQRSGPALLLWNHRWEYDKGPRMFFAALDALSERGLDFKVAILGKSFRVTPAEFLAARKRLGDRIVQFGYAKDPATYARWLWQADIAVSCAHHEFFGVSIAEAIYCDTWPLLPRRLAYPELLPADWHGACLYDDFDDLVARLSDAVEHVDAVRQRSLRPAVGRYDWPRMAPVYDDLLEELAA